VPDEIETVLPLSDFPTTSSVIVYNFDELQATTTNSRRKQYFRKVALHTGVIARIENLPERARRKYFSNNNATSGYCTATATRKESIGTGGTSHHRA
jgi:hypothetical protein